MLSSDSIPTQTYASGALWQLTALGTNNADEVAAGYYHSLVRKT